MYLFYFLGYWSCKQVSHWPVLHINIDDECSSIRANRWYDMEEQQERNWKTLCYISLVSFFVRFISTHRFVVVDELPSIHLVIVMLVDMDRKHSMKKSEQREELKIKSRTAWHRWHFIEAVYICLVTEYSDIYCSQLDEHRKMINEDFRRKVDWKFRETKRSWKNIYCQ